MLSLKSNNSLFVGLYVLRLLRNLFFVVRDLSADVPVHSVPVALVLALVPVAPVPDVLIPVLVHHGVTALIVGAIVLRVVTVAREAIVVLAVTALPVVIVDRVVLVPIQTPIVEEDRLFVSAIMSHQQTE